MNTVIWPTPGLVSSRHTSTRWPGCSVGTIEGLGILYGLIRNAWIRKASPTAIATVATSSTIDRVGPLLRLLMCVVREQRWVPLGPSAPWAPPGP